MDKVKSQSNNYKIYLSRSEDPKKNPLSPREKLSFMKKIFPQHAKNIEINSSNNILDILDEYKLWMRSPCTLDKNIIAANLID